MKVKVENVAARIGGICSGWSSVEALSLAELSGTDVLDPYFTLSFDVFYAGNLPGFEERRRAFEGTGAFETSLLQVKDRFLLDGLPVRLEYKSLASMEAYLEDGPAGRAALLGAGTYPLYRLQRGRPLFDRRGWLAAMRSRCDALPAASWRALAEHAAARMEHSLADLAAAARRDDAYFYLESTAGFARQVLALLFASNRSFEPSHRSIEDRLRELPRLPDDFRGRWESLLRTDLGISREQRYEIANLIAKSVLSLG